MTLFPVFHPPCLFVFSVVFFFFGGGGGVFVWYFPTVESALLFYRT